MRRIKLKQGVSLIHLVLIAALLFSVTPKIVAQEETTLSMVPQNNLFSTETTPVNSAFVVNATVTNVTNLYTWQLNVTFDPTMLKCLNASEPPDSPFINFSFPVSPIIDNVAGYVYWGATLIGEVPGANGTGVLMQMAFQIISAPTQGRTLSCDIAFSTPYGGDTFLYDPDGLLIPATVVNGYYEYTSPPPTLSIIPQNNVFSTQTTPINSTFVVNATVANVTDLWHWQVNVTFDPSMLACLNASVPSGSPFNFPNQTTPVIDNVAGYVMLGASQYSETPGVNGTGALATITFQITRTPTPTGTLSCDLNFSIPYGTDTFLLDSSLALIAPTLVNGYYQYTWPPTFLPYLEVRPSIYNATQVGEDVAIQVWAHNISEEWNVIGFQVILRFNASLLEPLSVSNGTFLESFVTSGESMWYFSSSGYVGDPALPPGYDAWLIGAIIMPDQNGTWHAPFPNGEGLLATLHFNATMETAYPQITETDLSFTYLENTPSNPYDNFNCYALDVNMDEIPFIQLINGTYRAYTCNLTIATTAGGTTSPAPGSYTYAVGTKVAVTANPTGFYVLDHWVLDGVNKTGNPITVTMDTDHALQAVFLLPNYTLTITTTAGGTVNATTQSYVAGTNVTVTASPSAGYNFSGWMLDSVSYTVNPITVTMNANHTLQAIFKDVTPPTIVAVTQSPPANNVLENAAVLVSANVTDAGSGVKNVTLVYTTDNWTTSNSLSMTLNPSTGLYEATIPGKALNSLVQYKIVAYDNAGYSAVDDNAGNYYVYTVIPEFSALGILLILLGTTLVALVLTKKSRKPRAQN